MYRRRVSRPEKGHFIRKCIALFCRRPNNIRGDKRHICHTISSEINSNKAVRSGCNRCSSVKTLSYFQIPQVRPPRERRNKHWDQKGVCPSSLQLQRETKEEPRKQALARAPRPRSPIPSLNLSHSSIWLCSHMADCRRGWRWNKSSAPPATVRCPRMLYSLLRRGVINQVICFTIRMMSISGNNL